jgi:hypothetical protein
MQLRAAVVAVVASATMLLLAQLQASANISWCIADPPIQVVTPDGHNLMVNTQVYLPPSAVHLKSAIHESAIAVRDSGGGTLIVVQVYVPAHARVVSSENRYGVSDAGNGSGVVTLYLHVPIS